MATEAMARGMAGLEAAVAARKALFAALVAVARDLLPLNGSDGTTVTQVRNVALMRGILHGNESRADLSILGAVMRAAGACNVGSTARSNIPKTHGNRQTVWYPVAA